MRPVPTARFSLPGPTAPKTFPAVTYAAMLWECDHHQKRRRRRAARVPWGRWLLAVQAAALIAAAVLTVSIYLAP